MKRTGKIAREWPVRFCSSIPHQGGHDCSTSLDNFLLLTVGGIVFPPHCSSRRFQSLCNRLF